ncbi:hypothetical protein [Azospirillum endophyticum]
MTHHRDDIPQGPGFFPVHKPGTPDSVSATPPDYPKGGWRLIRSMD